MPGPGGRRKGIPNKRSLVAPGVLEACAEKLRELKVIAPEASCDPLENLLIIAFDESTGIDQRVKIWTRLAEYCYPKRRSIELDDSREAVVPMTTAESIRVIEELLDKAETSPKPL